MDTVARLQRLVDLIAQAKALCSQSPVSCVLLQALRALSDEEAAELGTHHLNMDRHRRILNRLAEAIGIDTRIVFRALAGSLAWDLEDHAPTYVAARRAYEESCVPELEVRKWLKHQPPEAVAFLHNSQRCHWSSADEARGTGLGLVHCFDEDERRSMICKGYLVTAGLAFPTTVAFLLASMEQNWRDWQALWGYF
jgi:hypothetical protein